MKTKDLKSGTKLPLMSLKGKDYLQVAHRLVWFREEHPEGKIITEVMFSDENRAVVKAVVSIPHMNSGAWLELSSGHKSEQKGRFGDFLEKAETGAIGRALAVAGYGTQFEPEFDEEERIVDSPMPAPSRKKQENVGDEEPSPKATKPFATLAEDLSAVRQAPKLAPTQTIAPTNSITIPKGEGGVYTVTTVIDTAIQKPSDRDALNKRITAMSKVVIAKRLKTLEELKADMKSKYGADSTAGLDDAEAKELLTVLEGLANGT